MSCIGAVILTGGKSSRMGADKAGLELGGRTFLRRITEELHGFEERLLSVGHGERRPAQGLTLVEDITPNQGPMGGIYAALTACVSPYLLVVSCDIPLFSAGLADYLCQFVSEEYDIFIAVARSGRVQPLCAIYSKRAAGVLGDCLHAGNYRLMDVLSRLRVKYIPLAHSVYPDEAVCNINTPEDFSALLRRVSGPPIVAVCGVKNAGKTTLLCGVLPILCRYGLRVAVIKHDGHDFSPDVPGTDSDRIRRAGAYGTAVYSHYRYMITEARKGIEPDELAGRFSDADLILLEGGKGSPYPKIEVVRAAQSFAPVSDTNTLLAVCTDLPHPVPGVPNLGMDDYEGIARILLSFVK